MAGILSSAGLCSHVTVGDSGDVVVTAEMRIFCGKKCILGIIGVVWLVEKYFFIEISPFLGVLTAIKTSDSVAYQISIWKEV